MFITDLIKNAFCKKCTHEKISPLMEEGYCPDCGKFIRNEWYITRCSCCGAKAKAMYKNGKIVPQENFCLNCGNSNFYIEKLDKISFINVNFAVLVKKEFVEPKKFSTVQCWQEQPQELPRLIVKI